MLLMALATIRAESEGFAPVEEAPSRFNTSPDGEAFDLYDHRRDLGNAGRPDGRRFRGRGFVQLTGRDNYRRYGAAIGLGDQLIAEPYRALEPGLPPAGSWRRSWPTGSGRSRRRCSRAILPGPGAWSTAAGMAWIASPRPIEPGDALLDDPIWPQAHAPGRRA